MRRRGLFRNLGNTELNTFIGGVASTIPDAATLASKLVINESDIEYFGIVGSDIEVSINREFPIPAYSFQNSILLSFESGVATEIRQSTFSGCTYLESINCPNVVKMTTTPFYSGFTTFPNFTELHLPNMTDLGVQTQTGEFLKTFYVMASGCNLTLNNVLKTAGSGGVMHPEVQWLINNKSPNITWVD